MTPLTCRFVTTQDSSRLVRVSCAAKRRCDDLPIVLAGDPPQLTSDFRDRRVATISRMDADAHELALGGRREPKRAGDLRILFLVTENAKALLAETLLQPAVTPIVDRRWLHEELGDDRHAD
jgi:hypothetical protein